MHSMRVIFLGEAKVLLSGEKMAEGAGEGQVCIVEYRDEADGEVPYLMLVKEALVEEKQ